MAKKLHYFHYIGRAEPIRYILHYAGEKFEDVRYNINTWHVKNIKDSLPFGQLPIYEEGNKTLSQSLAIARYLGSKYNLLPDDPWEQAVLDSIVLSIYDFLEKIGPYYYERDHIKRRAMRKQILEVTADYFLSRFEKELKAHNGFFCGKLSWAEFVLIGIVETFNDGFGVEAEKTYPTMNALFQKIRALPGVKEYIARRYVV